MTGRARPNDPLASWCELALPGVCLGRASHRHHRLRRGQGGSDEFENTLDLCSACHDYAHGHIAEANERGWILRSGLGSVVEEAEAITRAAVE